MTENLTRIREEQLTELTCLCKERKRLRETGEHTWEFNQKERNRVQQVECQKICG